MQPKDVKVTIRGRGELLLTIASYYEGTTEIPSGDVRVTTSRRRKRRSSDDQAAMVQM